MCNGLRRSKNDDSRTNHSSVTYLSQIRNRRRKASAFYVKKVEKKFRKKGNPFEKKGYKSIILKREKNEKSLKKVSKMLGSH